jgi:hypothetical protein
MEEAKKALQAQRQTEQQQKITQEREKDCQKCDGPDKMDKEQRESCVPNNRTENPKRISDKGRRGKKDDRSKKRFNSPPSSVMTSSARSRRLPQLVREPAERGRGSRMRACRKPMEGSREAFQGRWLDEEHANNPRLPSANNAPPT